jgi:hypothetical protein
MARSVQPMPSRGLEGVMTYDRRDWEERQVQVLKQEIADRLRSVCAQVPDEEFDRLVDRIARIRRKYEQATVDELFPDNPS